MKNNYRSIVLIFILQLIVSLSISGNGKDTVYVAVDNGRLNKIIGEDHVILKVDKAPQYKGGKKKREEYIEKNTRYPEDVHLDSLTSRIVHLTFVVTEKGNVEDVTVVKGLVPELDAEAVRVVSSFPIMEPGKKDGKEVRTIVPYSFYFTKIDPAKEEVIQMPSFIGGERALQLYIGNKMNYPKGAQQRKEEGRVAVRFVVGKTGEIRDVEVVRSVSPELDKEAVRVISEMPDWNPGMRDNEPVSVYYTIPIIFKLKKVNANDGIFPGSGKKRQ